MSIGKAWCEEAGRIVDIVEAHNLYFANPPDRRDRFVFRCPDEECRREMNPLVTGVNYDKEAGTFTQRPHFKLNPTLHPHIANCPIAERDTALEELKKDSHCTEEGIIKPVRRQTINEFEPPYPGIDPDDLGLATPDVRDYSKRPRRRERIDTLKDKLINRTIRTRRLYEVVSCFEAMPYLQRKTIRLNIGQGPSTYYECFAPIGACRPGHNEKIYFGEATVTRKGKSYSIRFIKPAYEDSGASRKVSLFIKGITLDAYRWRAELQPLLNNAAENNLTICCYFFGDVITKKWPEGKESLDVEIAHLHTVVVREPLSKKSTNLKSTSSTSGPG